jgi:hypothetical protein
MSDSQEGLFDREDELPHPTFGKRDLGAAESTAGRNACPTYRSVGGNLSERRGEGKLAGSWVVLHSGVA